MATVGIAWGQTPVDYVNPYIGNISHLLVPTYPTVHLPNSMLRIVPQRNDYTGDLLGGLPMALTSHRGRSAFALSPQNGTPQTWQARCNYSYDNEHITPYSYNVRLDEAFINVRFAPTHQAAIYAFNFEKSDEKSLVITVDNGALQADGHGLSGYQQLDNSTRIYLYAETCQKAKSIAPLSNNSCAWAFAFDKKTTDVQLRYGISFISTEQAKANLQRELNTYDVDIVAQQGRHLWNETLGKIEVEGGTQGDRTVFYTAFYRTCERMICISEDGRYFSAADGRVHTDDGQPFYTDDWAWDTYRAVHPLRVLIEPKIECDMLASYVRMAKQSAEGWLPTFPEITGDSHRMNGNHAVAAITDAYVKGLRGFDVETAYQAAYQTLTQKSLLPWTRQALSALDSIYNQKGYFPALNIGERETCSAVHGWERRQSVAITLAACYDDWCLSTLAKALGHSADAQFFDTRSFNYRNIYNSQTGFFHPRNAQGNFVPDLDYRFSGGPGARDYYDENNGWTYRWDLQHNIADLVQLMGGANAFAANLDQTFREPLGKARSDFYSFMGDQTGNVGQFTMANEPSLHIPYLYNYAKQPWKTQKRIRTLLNQWFRPDLMGIPGDEDGGGLSGFVVFSAMGFYPVTPGKAMYDIGSPLFSRIRIHLPNGKTFEIVAEGNSPDNKYIQSATLNGHPWNTTYLRHSDLSNGGILLLHMGNKANTQWGTQRILE